MRDKTQQLQGQHWLPQSKLLRKPWWIKKHSKVPYRGVTNEDNSCDGIKYRHIKIIPG